MNRQTMLAVALAIGVGAASCADHPTAPRSDASVASPADASAQRSPSFAPKAKRDKSRAALLTAVPVSGTLSDGGSFVGTLTAKHIDYDETTKSLVMTGVISGTATTAAGVASAVTQQFTAPITLSRTAATSSVFHTTAMAVCDILFLDLGPLHLDLLGLTVDLAEVVLDLNAVSGAGNLLGNLLCAVVGLLDIPGAIASIIQLLDSINNILAGLMPPAAATGAGLFSPTPFVGGPTMLIST
ncbi:MAG TPA: hypothetical protein VHM30_09705 [Gemmatimonadaceae bacterium]|nr:hypothetical protein [Gemmatimonadaceae bacterium]